LPNSPPLVFVFAALLLPNENDEGGLEGWPNKFGLLWFWFWPKTPPPDPKPALPLPNAFVAVLEVPKRPPEGAADDCWPNKLPPAGLFPNRPPLPKPAVAVLEPKPDADEVVDPKGLEFVLAPKPALFVPKLPPKVLWPNPPA